MAGGGENVDGDMDESFDGMVLVTFGFSVKQSQERARSSFSRSVRSVLVDMLGRMSMELSCLLIREACLHEWCCSW